MAAGAFIPYTVNLDALVSGGVDLDSDTIVCALLTSSYTPGRTTHSAWSDASAAEVSGGGYTAGGVALTGKTVTHSGGTVTFDADDAVIGAAVTATAKYAVLVRRAGGALAAGDLLIAYADLDTGGGSVTGLGGAFTVQFSASGIFTVTGNSS